MVVVTDRLQAQIDRLQPAFEMSMDPICVVNTQNQIVYMTPSMRVFLEIAPRDLKKTIIFCDVVELVACAKGCKIRTVMQAGQVFKLDGGMAKYNDRNLRLTVRSSPIYDPMQPEKIIGATILLRDVTDDLILQAKYHKLMAMMQDKEKEVVETREKVLVLQKILRNAGLLKA